MKKRAPGWLGFKKGMKCHYPVIFRDYFINYEIRIPSLNNQDSNGIRKGPRVFSTRGSPEQRRASEIQQKKHPQNEGGPWKNRVTGPCKYGKFCGIYVRFLGVYSCFFVLHVGNQMCVCTRLQFLFLSIHLVGHVFYTCAVKKTTHVIMAAILIVNFLQNLRDV